MKTFKNLIAKRNGLLVKSKRPKSDTAFVKSRKQKIRYNVLFF